VPEAQAEQAHGERREVLGVQPSSKEGLLARVGVQSMFFEIQLHQFEEEEPARARYAARLLQVAAV